MDPLGDSAIVVQLGDRIELKIHQKVQTFLNHLENNPFPGMLEIVPAFTNVTVYYDSYAIFRHFAESSFATPYEVVRSILKETLATIDETVSYNPDIVTIPVCYEEEFGPDLQVVADYNQLTVEEVIKLHTEGEYITYMVGFAPGFPYLGGLSEKIAAPRRKNPRFSIPAGTVGIAGMQTGVYPLETPGGWQLIGRTPIKLFKPKQWPPTLIQAGNKIKFQAISRQEYDERLKEAVD